jgi:hypothetical protein
VVVLILVSARHGFIVEETANQHPAGQGIEGIGAHHSAGSGYEIADRVYQGGLFRCAVDIKDKDREEGIAQIRRGLSAYR